MVASDWICQGAFSPPLGDSNTASIAVTDLVLALVVQVFGATNDGARLAAACDDGALAENELWKFL
jgi:hypothetical protein